MSEQVPIDKALYFTAVADDGVTPLYSAVTDVGQVTACKWALLEADSEVEMMQVQHGAGLDFTDYDPLPEEVGAPIEAKTYSYGSDMIVCRQAHERTAFPPEDTPALFSTYRDEVDNMEWIENEEVFVGTQRYWDGHQYSALQSHTTQTGWEPPNVPALWQLIVEPSTVWQVGVAYSVGDQAYYPTDQDALYDCLQAHTSQVGWEPPNVPALWEVV